MGDPVPLHIPFSTRLVGVSSYQDAVRHLVEGAEVVVRAEPNNPFDPHAHVVTHSDRTVGYLSRAVAARMAVTGDGPWAAVVRDVFRNRTWGVEISVVGPADVAAPADLSAPGGEAVPAQTVDEEAAEPAALVVARHTQRVLGTYAGADSDAAVVFFDVAGSRLSAPADLVVVEAAPA